MTSRAVETLPGAQPFPEELQRKLIGAWEAKGPGYQPRTDVHDEQGKARYVNRLILEDSPYLIQHAHNPVNWHAWGEEAFEAAARRDVPIFLSIGYSTCHWCHVMERESFDNIKIARLMNERFVCVKLDREQRPDVDEIYMTAVLMTMGHGGWPMSSFLTPEGKPFFGGTYFPPDRFANLLLRIGQAWERESARLRSDAEKLAGAVATQLSARGQAREVGQAAIDKAVFQLLSRLDDTYGGFGDAPKFPHEPELLLLLQTGSRTGNTEALEAARHSLSAMARGGIHDQIGGGFARYSTDERWLVPHFEKMLYNQAQLGRAYLASYQWTGDRLHARVARQIFDYVLRDMTSPEGAFYSATDADSEGEEGLFFLWTPAQIRQALPPSEAELALDLFQISERGNFEEKNILHLPVSLEGYSKKRKLGLQELLERVDHLRERLYQVRETREHPLRDEKILTSWNAMMITALCEGEDVLGGGAYLKAARRAAEFLWTYNRTEGDGLWRVRLGPKSSVPALQEDYAFLIEAFLALYDSTFENLWLERAEQLSGSMVEKFWDASAGGFFMSAEGDRRLLARPKSNHDGAMPSGNSVAVRALARLAVRTGRLQARSRALEAAMSAASLLERHPAGLSYLLLGIDELLRGETGARAYGGAGALQAQGRCQAGQLEIHAKLKPGFHLGDEPARLSLQDPAWRLDLLQSGNPWKAQLSWQGREDSRPSFVQVQLRVQVCDETACQRPEEILLQIALEDAQ